MGRDKAGDGGAVKGCWPSRTVEREAGSESGSDIHPRYHYHYKARSSMREGSLLDTCRAVVQASSL